MGALCFPDLMSWRELKLDCARGRKHIAIPRQLINATLNETKKTIWGGEKQVTPTKAEWWVCRAFFSTSLVPKTFAEKLGKLRFLGSGAIGNIGDGEKVIGWTAFWTKPPGITLFSPLGYITACPLHQYSALPYGRPWLLIFPHDL